MDEETKQIAQEHHANWLGKRVIAIVETQNGYEIHQHTEDSVFPKSDYATKREAASRVLQLLGIGPVAPQTWPERACIGEVYLDDPTAS